VQHAACQVQSLARNFSLLATEHHERKEKQGADTGSETTQVACSDEQDWVTGESGNTSSNAAPQRTLWDAVEDAGESAVAGARGHNDSVLHRQTHVGAGAFAAATGDLQTWGGEAAAMCSSTTIELRGMAQKLLAEASPVSRSFSHRPAFIYF
jgi:hypothetical protein